jgi:CheY-like chemotaxis protein
MTKILLVEDDKSLREIYGVRLLAEGYDIVSAGDGEEALAMAIKERPNLIISDVMMPKISGFDMLDILRSTTETKTIRVIMMTALSSEEQRQRGESLGADRYLVKSQVGIEDVVRVVHEVLDDAPTSSVGGNFAAADYAAPAAPVAAAPLPQPSTAFASPAPSGYVSASPSAFETPRPAGSSERIIQPLPSTQNPAAAPDINALLDRELAAEASATAPIAPFAPQTPVTAFSDPSLALPPELQQQLGTPAPVSGVSSGIDGQPPTTPGQPAA